MEYKLKHLQNFCIFKMLMIVFCDLSASVEIVYAYLLSYCEWWMLSIL